MSGGAPDLQAAAQAAELQALTAIKLQTNDKAASKAPSDTENRTWIAQSIITSFLWSIGGVIMALFITSVVLQDAERWKEFSQALLDILKGVLLPVVTLILGYYFGQSSKADK